MRNETRGIVCFHNSALHLLILKCQRTWWFMWLARKKGEKRPFLSDRLEMWLQITFLLVQVYYCYWGLLDGLSAQKGNGFTSLSPKSASASDADVWLEAPGTVSVCLFRAAECKALWVGSPLTRGIWAHLTRLALLPPTSGHSGHSNCTSVPLPT